MEQVFPSIIEGIDSIDDDKSFNLELDKIHDELIYLHVFAYHQEISHHFESHVRIFSKKFNEEFEDYLMESMSEEDMLDFMIGLTMILLEYQKKYDEIVRNGENRKAVLLNFGSYIVRRVLGEKFENDIFYSYYMYILYGGIRKELKELIESSIEMDD